MNIILAYFSIKYKGDWDQIYRALEKKEKVTIEDIEKLSKQVESDGWKIITIIDKNYPNKIKQAYKPPFCLFLKGNEKMLSNKMIVATGDGANEAVTAYVDKSLENIEKSHFLINPLFKGVDQYVFKNSKKPSVYVLPCGLDKVPSYVNATDEDLLVTEYPYGCDPKREHFRNRNRLIAALGESLILYTTDKDSKMNHLINEFLNLGKEVFCFPGKGTEDEGNFTLVKQGARLITQVVDICK